ncbi:MAG: flagellar biosynthetic protein FliO, partial [Notoacmeibacter sp.]|nr:flagellar biosynthetic protein FliO [Notoacmeibacter sp.]
MDWLVETIGPAAATVVTWMVAVLVVLVLLLLVLRMLRGLLPGIYVRGGKSRHRLAVVDAAPVDANRRLILVRRDEVEHLLLIGGSGDVIVETGIGAPALQAQPAPRVQEAQSIARQQPS